MRRGRRSPRSAANERPASSVIRRWVRYIVGVIGILVFCVPVSAVITLFLLPLWSWIENRWNIESVGHSGPADWCFMVVYGLCVAAGGGAVLWLSRRLRGDRNAAGA